MFTNTNNPITITAQPADKAVPVRFGTTAQFTVVAEGEGLVYQWQDKAPTGSSWANTTDTGAKTAKVTVVAANWRNGYSFRCKITDSMGNTMYSEPAMFTVAHPIVITEQPQSVTTMANDAVMFRVVATGTDLRYRWERYSKFVGHWEAPNFMAFRRSLCRTRAWCSEKYRCIITDADGNTVISEPAVLTVK